MKVKIEKGIPIPERKYYAELKGMAKDDSFTFPEAEFGALRTAIMDLKKKHPMRKFKTIRISETSRRIWRKK